MTDDIIGQIINEVAESAPAEIAPSQSTGTIETPQETEKEIDLAPEPQDEPFSKKALNAMSYRDKKIGKLQAQLAADRLELQKFRDSTPKAADNAPSEADFDNYGDFLEAKITHKLTQGKQDEAKQQESAQTVTEQAAWRTERMNHIAEQEKTIATVLPDYMQTVNDNSEAIRNLPDYVQLAILEADEPHLALYVLAKEGRLYDLADMSERAAMILIGKAEARGEAMATRKTSKAPAPIGGLKGTGSSSKSLSQMSADEIVDKWYKNK